MATSAKVGIGAYLQRWDTVDTTGAWETVAEVKSITPGGISRNVVETFTLNNADDYVNKLQGVLNAGSIAALIAFTRAEFVKLKRDAETRGNRDYQIVMPDGEGFEFEGFISELPLGPFTSDGVMEAEVTIEIDGKPDFVSTASVIAPV